MINSSLINNGFLALLCLILIGFCSKANAQAYQADIDRWVAQDLLDPPESNAILFTGSSSIRRWEQLTRDFADYNVIQRGFGGSQFDDLVGFVDEIVLSYSPSAIVVWEGTNDIGISGGVAGSGNEVFADYQEFVTAVHAEQPNVEIFYLGIMPTPGRESNEPEQTIANNAIANFATLDPKLHYIDLPAAFATKNPYIDPEFTSLFVDDIHLNRAGYDFWTSIIRPEIETVIAPNKTFVANPNTLQPGERLLFDFGPSNSEDGDLTNNPDSRGNHWNNWHPAEGGIAINAGEHIGNLIDTDGNETGIDLTITGGFLSNGKLNGGLSSPDENLLRNLAVESATQDYFFSTADGVQGGGSDDVPGGFMLSGLDPNQIYEFRFFGSRNTTALRQTEYLVTGTESQSVLLQTSGINIGSDGVHDGNDDELAIVSGVRPDEFGQVFVDITMAARGFAYINAMEVIASVPEPSSIVGLLVCLSTTPFFARRRV